MRIAIIGAGLAGLGAGYRLKKAGLEPVIFERESYAGGRASSEEIDGFIIDKGAYTIPEYHRHFLDLTKELGLSDHLVQTPATSSTFAKGIEHKMKIGSPKDFLKYKLINLRDKKDLVKIFLYGQALRRSLDLNSPNQKTFELERETASDYLLENYSPELLEHIAYPIFADLFLGLPEQNSKAAFLATLRNLTRYKIYSLAQGMGMLAEALTERLDVRLDTPVIEIRRGHGQGPYQVEIGGEGSASLEFDGIIFAVPLPLVPEFFHDFPESLKESLSNVKFTPSISVAMGLMRPYTDFSMMNNVVRSEFKTLATLVFDYHKGGRRIPPGKGLASAILTVDASRRFMGESDSAVTEAVLGEIDSLKPGFSEDLLFSRVHRWNHGGVQLPPGTLKAQVSLRRELASRFQNIAFAGDGLYRASMEVSLKTGYRAADRILKRCPTSFFSNA